MTYFVTGATGFIGRHLLERLLERKQRLERVRALAADRRMDAEEASDRLEAARGEWRRWLSGLGLSDALTPEAALEVFELADNAREHLHAIGRLQAKLSDADERWAAYRSAVIALCAAEPSAAAAASDEPAAGLRLLLAAMMRQQAERQAVEALRSSVDELERQAAQADAALQAHASIVREWLEQSGAADVIGYERLLEEAKLAARLDAERIRIEVELYAGMPAERRRMLDELLEGQDEPSLTALAESARAAHDRAAGRHAELLERRGRLLQQLDQLQREDERRELLQEREAIASRLERDAARYEELAVMAALIRRTKQVLENERQPAVLREASRYAAQLTEGRYMRIIAPPGETAIKLETRDGAIVDAGFLSRGTAEQLYLALRLSLADAVEPADPLPMLLDDLFVNFDRDRLHATAQILSGISANKGRQLIMMTCHDHVLDALSASMPHAKVIELNR